MKSPVMAAIAAGILMPALAFPSLASAQSAHEVRHSAREVEKDRRDLRQAERYGSRHDVREARADLRDSKRELREDWRDYKRAHRDVYRRPAYVGPRGYAYRPVVVGHRFAPAYYGNHYWVRDYGRYHLPPPRAHARWIRYGNDVVMIDVRNGRVISVYNGFFW